MSSTAQQRKDEADILALIERWSRAIEAKDPARIVEAYTPETVLYDAIPPYRTVGKDAIAALWAQCFPYFPEKFRSEHKDLQVEVSGDLAFVHGLHHFVPEPADHPCGMTSMRVTACYKRIDGQWKVAHEHVSVPFDPMTGKASFITDEGGEQPAPSYVADTGASSDAPTSVHPVTPHLVCAGAADAIEFYKKAFGATEVMRLADPKGKLMHGCVNINGSSVMLVDEYPEVGAVGPQSLKGTPVTIHLTVPDVDAAVKQATEAGAKIVMPVADMFWGDRYGVVEDPFGHRWSIATPKRALSVTEIEAASKHAQCAA